MSEWEYITVNLSDLPRDTGELDLLNDAGKNGWELIAIVSNNIAYLKREVAKAKPATTKARSRSIAK
jgi:hypothetical protein